MRALKVVWMRECVFDAWAVQSVDVCSPGRYYCDFERLT